MMTALITTTIILAVALIATVATLLFLDYVIGPNDEAI